MAKAKSVLLVEDNEDDVFLMQRAWQKASIPNSLQIVNDGQQAVDYLAGVGDYADREHSPIPCLVLLDIKLPYLSGFEVMEWIRASEKYETLNVIFLTSSNNAADIEQAYSSGGNAYLVKPATPEKLTEIVQDLKNFWIKHNQFPQAPLEPRREPC